MNRVSRAGKSGGARLSPLNFRAFAWIAARRTSLRCLDDYANANKLRYFGADQLAIKASLEASGFSREQIFLLHDGAAENRYRPSRGNIEKQLDIVLMLAGEDDLLFLAFSGHEQRAARLHYGALSDTVKLLGSSKAILNEAMEAARGGSRCREEG